MPSPNQLSDEPAASPIGIGGVSLSPLASLRWLFGLPISHRSGNIWTIPEPETLLSQRAAKPVFNPDMVSTVARHQTSAYPHS